MLYLMCGTSTSNQNKTITVDTSVCGGVPIDENITSNCITIRAGEQKITT